MTKHEKALREEYLRGVNNGIAMGRKAMREEIRDALVEALDLYAIFEPKHEGD